MRLRAEAVTRYKAEDTNAAPASKFLIEKTWEGRVFGGECQWQWMTIKDKPNPYPF